MQLAARRTSQPSPARQPVTRRQVLQAGGIGLLGLSMADVAAWRSAVAASAAKSSATKPRAVIFLFLTGGASQHDTFDMKPDGPAEFKGEFKPIATRTPGIQICEHLPMLAQRSQHWALVRSLTHTNNDHETGTYVMLTGRSEVPPTFRSSQPQGTDLALDRRHRRRHDPAPRHLAGQRRPAREDLPLEHRHLSRPVRRPAGEPARAVVHRVRPTSRTPITPTPGLFRSICSTCTRGSSPTSSTGASSVANLTLPEGVLEGRFRDRRAPARPRRATAAAARRAQRDRRAAEGYDRVAPVGRVAADQPGGAATPSTSARPMRASSSATATIRSAGRC